MPWALWFVAILLASMWIPVGGYWVAYFTVIFSFLATNSLPAMIGAFFKSGEHEINGPMVVTQFVRTEGPPLRGWDYLWGLVGWTGVAWLVAIVVLCAWIAIRMHAGQGVRGVTNLLILVFGWPMCFWLAMYVVSTTASD
jgi:hypothetical protein